MRKGFYILFIILSFLFLFDLRVVFPADPIDAERMYTIAKKAYEDNLLDLSTFEFEKYLAAYPSGEKRDSVLFYIGDISIKKGKLSRAQEVFSKLKREYPGSPWTERALLSLGFSFFQQKAFPQAAEEFNNYRKNFPAGGWADEALYWQAESLLKQGKGEEAASLYKKLLTAFPKSRLLEYALYSLGWLYQEKGAYSDALTYLFKFELYFPKSSLLPKIRFMIAQTLSASGEYKEANQRILLLLEAKDSGGKYLEQGYFLLAENFYRLEDFPSALNYYTKIRKEFPNSSYTQTINYRVAMIAFKQEKWIEAAQKFQETLQANPQHPEREAILYYIAISYLNLSEFDKSLPFLDELINQFPQGKFLMPALAKRGEIHFKKGSFALSEEDFSRLAEKVQKADQKATALYMAGESQFQRGNLLNALKTFESLNLQDLPQEEQKESLYKIGFAYYKLGQYKGTIDTWEKLVSLFPNLGNKRKILLALGDSYQSLGKYQEAVAKYSPLIQGNEKDDVNYEALTRLALCYKKLGQMEEALAVLHRLNEERPSVESLLQMGLLLYQKGDHRLALEPFQNAAIAPNTSLAAEATFWLGEAYYSLGEYKQSLETLKSLTDKFPAEHSWLELAYSRLGSLYEMEENWSSALEAYQKVLDLSQDRKLVIKTREKIEKIKQFTKVER